MAAVIPAKLRDAQITSFAKRAAQLERFKPIITYWLRFYITQKIIGKGLHLADQECTTYTTDLMEKLEKTKAEHPNEDALLDEVAAYAYCEQFALQTFAKGDNEIRNNKVTEATADTLLAASTFLELLSIWKNPLEAEIKSKLTYAKYHALRIVKAVKAGEDPNLSNPKQEAPPAVSPAALDPNDPEVKSINDGVPKPPMRNPYQSYVESAPDTSTQPSPTFSAPAASPPHNLPSAPTGYSQSTPPPVFSSHQDVSPISQPAKSRQGSVVSVGGGYFPRVDVPTFTAENTAPGLPTAPSMDDEPMTSPPQAPQAPQPLQPSDPQSFYQSQASPPPIQQPPPFQQTIHQQPPSQPPFQPQQSGYASPPPQLSHQPPAFQPNPYSPQPSQPPQPMQSQPPPQSFFQPSPSAPQTLHQGPFRTDEESVMEAQKHAKWAISALNFEDVNTAVKELRTALRALGAG